MIAVHGFYDGELYFKKSLNHLPRVGDTVRLGEFTYAKVTEVIWCLDEWAPKDFQRVNLRMEALVDSEEESK